MKWYHHLAHGLFRPRLSAFTILLGNLNVLYFAFESQISIITLVLGYIAQNIIIGFFSALKPIIKERNSTKLFRISLQSTYYLIVFALINIGYGYAIVNIKENLPHMNTNITNILFTFPDLETVKIIAIVFFFTHFISFILNFIIKKEYKYEKGSPARHYFRESFERITPMSAVLIPYIGLLQFLPFYGFGGFLLTPIGMSTGYIILKTVFDFSSHIIEHEKNDKLNNHPY